MKTPNADIVRELAKLHTYLKTQASCDVGSEPWEQGMNQAYRDALAHLEAIMERIR